MRLAFENCVLDLNRRELSLGGQVVATAPKVFDLLVYLVEHRERVVSRDELIATVWAGRIVSESTLASHINAVRNSVGDNGQQQRVIRTVARKGFRFCAEVAQTDTLDDAGLPSAEPSRADEASEPLLASKPSIAVLPFVNLSSDPEQDYLADGVVEDIIAALSRYHWLFVVARNSSFTYKARAVDVKEIGRVLGVRYVLEGSWRKANRRVRITCQLVDTTTGANHWAGRFEGILDDIFDLQDQVTESVVGAIAPQLERAEIERARLKPTESLDAYDYYLRGMAKLHRGSQDSVDQALSLYLKAIAIDPDYALAYAMAAWCYCWRKVNRWMTDYPREIAEGVRLARRALELDKSDALVLTRSGHALAHLAGELSAGIALLDRALALNSNLAVARFLGAFLRLWHGETEEAIEYFTHAMGLSPLDPELYRMQAGMATAHLFLGHYDKASELAEQAIRELPSFLLASVAHTASLALAGRTTEAERAIEHLRRLDPRLRLSNLPDWLPIRHREHLATLVEGLREAGLPE